VTTSEFIKRINIVPELEKSDRDFFVPVIAETVQLIERDAHLLYMAAKLYYDVSNEYMMEQIAGVSKFLVLQTDEQREHHLALLHNMTLINSVKVKKLAEKRNQLYHIRTAQRQIEYKEFINHYQPEVIAA
jgi:ferritin